MKLAGLLLIPLAASAAEGEAFFRERVEPILKQRCYECHSHAGKIKGGLVLDSRSGWQTGGESGPALVPGSLEQSRLIEAVRYTNPHLVMPPKAKLSAAEIAVLEEWVKRGAPDPRATVAAAKVVKKTGVDVEAGRKHWAYQPVRDHVLPAVRDKAWPLNEVDAFILAKQEAAGLKPGPEAERHTWLRRVTLDLTGLPPTPEEVEAFTRQRQPDYAAVVERLLASPRYGERWAQHWLDVVRYADTHGFEVNTERPNAWPYRDYVIRALNSDTPYDRFIKEQIVGDALGEDAATGFLVTASVLLPGQIGKDAPSIRLARQDSLDEIVNNISQTFLGLSVGCARCHDHKFDPVTAKDYYAMQAFVAGVEYEDRELRTPEAEMLKKESSAARERDAWLVGRLSQLSPVATPGRTNGVLRPTVRATMNVDRFTPVRAKRVRFTIRATNSLEPCVDELEVFNTAGTNVALASAGAKFTTSGDSVSPNRHEPQFINDGRYGNERSWMSSQRGRGWVEIEFAREEEISRLVWGRDRLGKFEDRLATDYTIEVAGEAGWKAVADASDRRPFVAGMGGGPEFTTDGLRPDEADEVKRLLAERSSLAGKIKLAEQGQLAFAGKFRAPDVIHLLARGDPEQPKEEVTPAVLSALGTLVLAKTTPEQQRRHALADWIGSPQNPLTARVMVNRIWQGHFGVGLVETPSDFGRSGVKPTHPELLDWLAGEFIRSGWSVKAMHRLIVLSATYRQSSAVNAKAAAKDSDVRLLWRYPSRRMEAEMLRDSMLAVSGGLNLVMFGRGYDLFAQRGGLSGFTPVEKFTPENQRRMIYAHKVRRESEAVFGAFDCPDAGQSTAIRRASTTPIQALNLFNSRFTLTQSDAFAARVRNEAGDDMAAQIRRAYQLALSRAPSALELSDAQPAVRQHGLALLCRALFNSNEFLFIP